MGEIISAFAASHAPQILVRPKNEKKEWVEAVHQGYYRMRDELKALRPDALIVISNDHMESFFAAGYPTFAIYAGETVFGTFGERYDRDYDVHAPLANALFEHCMEAEFDATICKKGSMGHGFVVPLHFVLRDVEIPVIPIFVNAYAVPQPKPSRCYAFGKALADGIANRPERVAVLATGGMSHYPGTDKYPHPNHDADRRYLETLTSERAPDFGRVTSEELDETGNPELRSWVTALGIMQGKAAELVTYQPSWHIGFGVIRWPLN
jgi:protocatechuate 4,5-dioxygenase beta chain/2,3-dihydroxyphenylpropionate 1,2-dioxygenase